VTPLRQAVIRIVNRAKRIPTLHQVRAALAQVGFEYTSEASLRHHLTQEGFDLLDCPPADSRPHRTLVYPKMPPEAP